MAKFQRQIQMHVTLSEMTVRLKLLDKYYSGHVSKNIATVWPQHKLFSIEIVIICGYILAVGGSLP